MRAKGSDNNVLPLIGQDKIMPTPGSPVRNVISILCVTLIVAFTANVLLSYDFTTIAHFRRSSTTSDASTVDSSLSARLNSTLSSLLDQKLSAYLSSNHNSSQVSTTTTTPNSASIQNEPMTNAELLQLRERQNKVNYSAVWMSPIEIDVVLRHLGNVETYLEWGSGGSTLNFAPFAKKIAHSIEHDVTWCSDMQQQSQASHVHIHCVPVRRGAKRWGLTNPFEEGTYDQFRDYVDKIEDLDIPIFDFILDDGRARVPAAVKALSFIGNKSVVVLHDAERAFKSARGYQKVWKYYDAVDSVGGINRQGLVVLRRKEEYDYLQGQHEQVQKLLDENYS